MQTNDDFEVVGRLVHFCGTKEIIANYIECGYRDCTIAAVVSQKQPTVRPANEISLPCLIFRQQAPLCKQGELSSFYTVCAGVASLLPFVWPLEPFAAFFS
jgi:hypothetical protein